jgi:diguanylate cyclase (GGDEF)-like protein
MDGAAGTGPDEHGLDSERWETLEPALPLVYVAEYARDGTIRYISDVVRDWTGREPEEFIAEGGLWYQHIHPDDRARVLEAEDRLFETREQLDLEYRLVGPDGVPRWVWERNTIVRDPQGKPICTHGTVVDLSRFGASAVDGDAVDGHAALVLRHNFMTGLPTRQALSEHVKLALERARRNGHVVALLDIDMDRFRGVNDAVGHAAGDLVLMQVARRLDACLEPGELLVHADSDEFLLMVSDLKPGDAAVTIAGVTARVGEVLSPPFESSGQQLNLRASIGYAIGPQDGVDPDELHNAAHAAVAIAKAAGRGTVRRYRLDAAQPLRRLSVDYRLRKAIESGDILPHYQPIVDLPSGSVSGVEALVRWQLEDGSVLAAGAVVPAAEESSLIIDLDIHMLSQVCAQAREWRDQGRGLAVHVNVSARMVRWAGFTRSVLHAISQAGLQPQDIVLELTETNSAITELGAKALVELRDAGVHLALDDFGAGFASLERLRLAPVSIVKLDRLLLLAATGDLPEAERLGPASVTAEAGRIVLAGLIRMAGVLGVSNIVEGVETPAMRDLLVELGAPSAQGYLFGRPAPATEFIAAIDAGRSVQSDAV